MTEQGTGQQPGCVARTEERIIVEKNLSLTYLRVFELAVPTSN